MEIKRQQEMVEAFHYDKRTPETQEVATDLRIGFSPLKAPDKNYPKENSILAARLEFRLVFDEFILTGSISQINHIINRQVMQQTDLSQEEVNELVEPLFEILKRMTYELTEIALDRPGITLNFQSAEQAAEAETEEATQN